MSFPLEAALLATAGLVAGALNVVAGGGSFLTLPVLIFLGLPAPVANASNRVGVLAQNLSGLWGFHRHGVVDWRWALAASVPAVAGAGVGTWLALRVSDAAFTRLLSGAMLAVTFWSLWRRAHASGTDATSVAVDAVGPGMAAGFFLVGIYGGFVQAGVGFFVLALTSSAGMDLVRGNAVKLLAVLLMTVLSLVLFAQAGTVDWPRGAVLAAGNFAGGFIGVHLAVLKGQRWLERVVIATVIVMALLLLVR